MERTSIQQYATGMIKALSEQAKAISPLKHNPTKGKLRELFVTQILKQFLTPQFGVGSGVITNQRGDQSRETDIIIYDKRILPPFIREENVGVFPIEVVIETIEIKSRLGKAELVEAESAALRIKEMSVTGTIYNSDARPSAPGSTVFAFTGHGLSDLNEVESGRLWIAVTSLLFGASAFST